MGQYQRWLQWPAHTQGRKSGRENLEFRLSWCSKNVQEGNRHFGTQRYDFVPNTSQWRQHRSGARFQNSARNAKNEVRGRRSALS